MSGSGETEPRRRHTVVHSEQISSDPLRIAEIEAANGLRQFDLGRSIAQEALDRAESTGTPFRLRPSLLMTLHRAALDGLSRTAGAYRSGPVSIQGSPHQPPPPHLVPELVESLCEYVNENWASGTAIHLGSFVMWRLNWIHPFEDGNGRTSRISAYLIMTIKSGYILPGTPTIPDQIVSDRTRYFKALESADRSCAAGAPDLSEMENLLAGMLARQLAGFYKAAGGKLPPGVDDEF